jgi:hypothetical protein
MHVLVIACKADKVAEPQAIFEATGLCYFNPWTNTSDDHV